MSSMLKSDGCYHYTGECYEYQVKAAYAGVVCLQCNNCVIYT